CFFSSRRRHTRFSRDWSSDVCSSDLGLSEKELLAPLGPKGADFAELPMAELVLHLNREVMHHGGEICLLRDLYRATGASGREDQIGRASCRGRMPQSRRGSCATTVE